MTPNWLGQQPWMQMPPFRPGKSVGQGIVEGAGAIGSALANRGDDENGPAAPEHDPMSERNSTMNSWTDKIGPPGHGLGPAQPDMPAHEMAPQQPQYVAPPPNGADNPLLKKKPDILSLLMGGGGAGMMA